MEKELWFQRNEKTQEINKKNKIKITDLALYRHTFI